MEQELAQASLIRYPFVGKLEDCSNRGFGFIKRSEDRFFAHTTNEKPEMRPIQRLEGKYCAFVIGGDPHQYNARKKGWDSVAVEWILLEDIAPELTPESFLQKRREKIKSLRIEELIKLLSTEWYVEKWERTAKDTPQGKLTPDKLLEDTLWARMEGCTDIDEFWILLKALFTSPYFLVKETDYKEVLWNFDSNNWRMQVFKDVCKSNPGIWTFDASARFNFINRCRLQLIDIEKDEYRIIQNDLKRAAREEEKRLAKEKERERREKQEKVKKEREARHEQAIAKLKKCLSEDFLSVQNLYDTELNEFVSENEFDTKLVEFIQNWFKAAKPLICPDDEQARAIASCWQDSLVIARAGSGKTATIVNRAIFLHKHCGVDTQQILLLAFNKKAAKEMKERLEKLTFPTKWPHVMTFHALAWAIVQPKEKVLRNEDKDEKLHVAVQEVIEEYRKTPKNLRLIRELMLAKWRTDWEEIEKGGFDLSKDDFLKFRRSLLRETISGERVKSFGEKVIANFLFEHKIKYSYEYSHQWDKRVYRPDFTHFITKNSGIIIEYFGMKGIPEYDRKREEKKTYWEKRPEWKLIEVIPDDITREDFEDWFQQELKQNGVTCKRLSEDKIWNEANKEKRVINRFTKAVTTFIQRARKLKYSEEDLRDRVKNHQYNTEIEKMFLDLAVPLFAKYLENIKIKNQEDFDGLLARAVEQISNGNTEFYRDSGNGDLAKMRFVFVDEYQDFTKLFSELLSGIRNQNPSTQFFCVGDDWQAINAFAGSDLNYFHGFEQHFENARTLHLTTNYRSCSRIVETGNSLMKPIGGSSAQAQKSEDGKVLLGNISEFLGKEELGNTYAALRRIILDYFHEDSWILGNTKGLYEERKVVFLSRTNSPLWPFKGKDDETAKAEKHLLKENNKYVGRSTTQKSKELEGEDNKAEFDSFIATLKEILPENQKELLSMSTTHKYKGLEGNLVVVHDAIEGRYPLVHPDWIFTRVFGNTLKKVIEDERRLFYVALSRAKNVLIILTDIDEESPSIDKSSPFLKDLGNIHRLKWNELRPCKLIIKIGNAEGCGSLPTINIKDDLKKDGFLYSESSWISWNKSVSAEDFDIHSFYYGSSWSCNANGLEIRICDSNERVIERYNVSKGSLQRLS